MGEACPAKCLDKCTIQYTYESCILYYTLIQRSMLHMMTWLKSPHKVSVTPAVVGNIVSDETAFCSHHAVAWTEGTTVAWIQIFNSRHSEISMSILKFLANPMVRQLKSYHLPIDIAELSPGTAQS